MSYLFNNKVGFEESALDAFARLKTSTPFTLFDSQHRYKDNGKYDTYGISGGTAIYNINESSVSLVSYGISGSKVIRQSKRTFPYQPGKSLLILQTFTMAEPLDGLLQKVGYFGEQNGVFLEKHGTTLGFVLRSFVTGTTSETRVYQSDWNGDKFDGTGVSGRTIDTTKANIMWLDVEWLGVGDVRCGFFVDGRPVLAHTFHNDNMNNTTYMTTACLSLRKEIENTIEVGAGCTSTMREICASVISEGGYDATSTVDHQGTGLTAKALSTAKQNYQIASIRLKSDRLDSIVVPANVTVTLVPQNMNQFAAARWELIANATLAGATWNSYGTGSAVEYSNNASSVTGGTTVRSGFFTTTGVLDLGGGGIREFSYQLGRGVTGTPETLTLAVAGYVGGDSVLGELGWYEII
jgi:hypothetical protein